MNHILFRRFGVVSSGFILIFGLTACGGGDETPNPTPTLPTMPEVSVQDTSGLENSGDLSFLVSLSAPGTDNVTVSYETLDGSATQTTDYQATTGELTFTPGETSQTITVAIINDSEPEPSESLHLVLADPQNATLGDDTGVGTILDDDNAMEQASDFNPNWGTAGVFSAAESCTTCHRPSSDQDPTIPTVMRYPLQDNGEDISPTTQWRHSIMAHAFDDPYYQAKVQEETHIFPELAGFIEDKCLTCHSPMGRTNAHQTETNLSKDASCPLDDGCYRLDTASEDMSAREGVSCTLCHQIQGDNLGSEDTFSGEYDIADADDTNAFTIYGPYQNPLTGPMQNNTPYTPVAANHMTGSEHCATCHTLYTPTLTVEDGTPNGNKFLEQAPYLEWQNSIYKTGSVEEQQCQDCHMAAPSDTYETRISLTANGVVNENWQPRSPFATHSMVGGNTHVLQLLRDYRDVLGITNSTTVAGFDEKITQTRELLENKTASVDIASINIVNDQLNVDVKVTNNTGHKLPTGFPSRRVWLQLTVVNADNKIIFESGKPDVNGYLSTDIQRLAAECLAIAKPEGFDSSNCYEPHRDVITDESQIAIYETVLSDTNSDITHVLLHADSYLKENRIPPQGFINSQANLIEPQTLPVGVNGDADFNVANNQEGSGSDTVHYRVSVDGQNGPYTVETKLHYQAIQPSFVNSLHADAGKVNRFKVMYAENPPTVETLAQTSAVTN